MTKQSPGWSAPLKHRATNPATTLISISGRVYLAKGMINRARECFQQALNIEPRHAEARQAIENIRRMLN